MKAICAIPNCGKVAPVNDAFCFTHSDNHEPRPYAYCCNEALRAADTHFGPFAEITINGQHDADDLRVIAQIRAAIAAAEGGE